MRKKNKKSSNLQVGLNIKRIRETCGYSQAYMASMIDVSQKTFSNIENNLSHPGMDVLEQIAKVLSVSLLQLINYPENDMPQEDLSPGINEDHESALTNDSAMMNDKGGQFIRPRLIPSKERELYERLLRAKEAEIVALKSMLAQKPSQLSY
ncbi:MAG: helix-turn-helix transcriptional regulator [Bacteroidetes bacterium]|nr:helix-turn-helix transcriptional regulator [Bacteroidota bacterium]